MKKKGFVDRVVEFFNGTDGKPIMLTTVLMKDDCTRLFGEFADNGLNKTKRLIIIAEDEQENIDVEISESCEAAHAVGMLEIAAHLIKGNGHG